MNQSQDSDRSVKEKILLCQKTINETRLTLDKTDLRKITEQGVNMLIKNLENVLDLIKEIDNEDSSSLPKYIHTIGGLHKSLYDTIAELQIIGFVLSEQTHLDIIERAESMRSIYKGLYNCRFYLRDALHTFLPSLKRE